jgi:hypothetical protein
VGLSRAGDFAAARRACRVVTRAMRVFPIARPSAALHGGRLALLRGAAPPAVVLERWRKAVPLARAMTLPLHELRLHEAIVQLEGEAQRRGGHERRIRELRREMELDREEPANRPVAAARGG